MSGDPNPYDQPQAAAIASLPDGIDAAEAERIRRDHLGIESWIRGFGALWALAAVFWLVLAAPPQVRGWWHSGCPFDSRFVILLGGPITSVVQLAGGIQLARRRRSGRVLMTLWVAARTILFALPFNTGRAPVGGVSMAMALLMPLVILASLWQPKASTVLSARYREQVVAATPHLGFRPPWWASVVLVILGVAMVLALLQRAGVLR